MALKKITVNNVAMENQRKSPLYQTIIVDLCNAGAIDASIAAGLLGEEVPDYLHLPRNFDKFVESYEKPDEEKESADEEKLEIKVPSVDKVPDDKEDEVKESADENVASKLKNL